MTKPKLNLAGEDGNIFAILGRASRLLKQNGQIKEADQMYFRVTSSGSYEEALRIISEYVETELSPLLDSVSQREEDGIHSHLQDIARAHIYPVELRGGLEYRGNEDDDFIIVSVGCLDSALRAAYDLGRGAKERETERPRSSAQHQKHRRGHHHER